MAIKPKTDSNPLVSVVIINWNRKDVIKETLLEMKKQTYDNYDIIVVDNNSTDGAPDVIEVDFPEVKLIRLKENVGIKGYNIAFENSKGEIIVILDNDSFLERDGIKKIVEKFKKYPNLGALGCKVYDSNSKKVHHWHPKVRDENGPEEGFESPLFNGCAAAVRRNVLEEVGFYPEEYFLYENERDLCTRIINAGYDVRYYTDIVGYHKVSDVGRSSDRLIYFQTRNLLWYYWKYLPLLLSLRKSVKLMIGNLIYSLITGRFKTYLCPIAHSVMHLPMILKKRMPIRKEVISKVLY